ncbi:plasma kallikrein-like [Anopheles darlingi]|uniref:plasma kallikrein-like n=1 Tax=Anopheles darlingi TaxID=43151 RepID=UPI002100146E|nr:plasma kallikrein-like [Anopheles darlingi]
MRPLLELWIISLVCLPIFGGEPGVHPLLVENPSQNLIRSKRMAGGTEVESAEDVPYQASIRLLDPDRHLASGAILNFRFVVTQASFIVKLYRVYPGQELPALARVRLGQVELQSSVNDQFQEIGSYVIHPNFSFIEARHDVALLKTVGVISFNQRVQPIVLRKGPIQDNTYVQYTDWGADTVHRCLLLHSYIEPLGH